jgi:Zn-dependent peptidase ImmA (M78 family)
VVQIRDAAIREVANRYGTSPEAVLRRLVILGRLPLAFYRRKRQEYARAFERHSRMPREGGFAPPYTMAVATSGNLFTRLVLQAYDDERITSSDVAEHLGVRLKHLDRIRAAVREEPSSGWPA